MPGARSIGASQEPAAARARTRRVVLLSLASQIPETAALAAAAVVTGSSALVAQTFAAGADLAVQVFLVIGVEASARKPDETHPLGYGRERYFWSLYAALAIFVSGFAVTIEETLRSIIRPTPITSFALGYVVLGAGVVLEGVALAAAMRETRRRAREQGRSIVQQLRRTTEPVAATELIGNGIGVGGAVLAVVALAVTQATGSTWPDTIASGLIGVALMAAAFALTQLNRSLLTGRGVGPQVLESMRSVVAALPGVVAVPTLFAVVVGPSMLVVDGEVNFADDLSVPELESVLDRAGTELRSRWPAIRYVSLSPIGEPLSPA